MRQTKFTLKKGEEIEFSEDKIEFKIKNNSDKNKYFKIEFRNVR